jgi:hypothetical protein
MQKKLITLIVILCIFLSLLVYQAHSLSKPHVSDLLIEEHGDLFLLLPISNKKVSVNYSYRSELAKTDLDSLREAERKLWDRINSYSKRQEPCFTIIHAKDGQVVLHVELIVIYDPPHIPDWPTSPDPTAPTPPQRGCGISHDHLYFYEVISKPTEPPTEPSTEATKEEIINGNTEGPPLTHETIVP